MCRRCWSTWRAPRPWPDSLLSPLGATSRPAWPGCSTTSANTARPFKVVCRAAAVRWTIPPPVRRKRSACGSRKRPSPLPATTAVCRMAVLPPTAARYPPYSDGSKKPSSPAKPGPGRSSPAFQAQSARRRSRPTISAKPFTPECSILAW